MFTINVHCWTYRKSSKLWKSFIFNSHIYSIWLILIFFSLSPSTSLNTYSILRPIKTRAIQQLHRYYCMTFHLDFWMRKQKKTLLIISKYIVQFQRQENSFPIPFRMISLAQCQLYSFYHSQLLNEKMKETKAVQIGWDLCITLKKYNSHRWKTFNFQSKFQDEFTN